MLLDHEATRERLIAQWENNPFFLLQSRVTPPVHHVNVIKLKWEIIRLYEQAGYLTYLGSPTSI